MKFVITEVQRSVDWLEGLKVDIYFTLFAFACDYFTTIDDEPVGRNLVVELQTLLSRSNSRKNRETIDTGFDVGCGAVLIRQHLAHARDLILRWDD